LALLGVGIGVSGYASRKEDVMSIDPNTMPIEGGLRIRVAINTADRDVAVQIGGVDAADPAVIDGFAYATAPALSADSYDVTVTQAGTATSAGRITYVEDLLPAVEGAVGAYVIALRELAAEASAAPDDQARERIVADRDMRGNAVDTVVHARAEALQENVETPEVDAVWDAAAADIAPLEEQISGPAMV
jgi:hypothetical protein